MEIQWARTSNVYWPIIKIRSMTEQKHFTRPILLCYYTETHAAVTWYFNFSCQCAHFSTQNRGSCLLKSRNLVRFWGAKSPDPLIRGFAHGPQLCAHHEFVTLGAQIWQIAPCLYVDSIRSNHTTRICCRFAGDLLAICCRLAGDALLLLHWIF